MSLNRIVACCLLAFLATGCKAQDSASTAPLTETPQLIRRIEVMIRSQFDVPPDVDVTLGKLTKSEYPGYQNLPLTFSGKGQSTTVNFLLSNDGNTLARLEKFDISHSPAEMITTQGRPVRGNPAAKVTIINFDDLECPYCAQMHEELFPQTAERYKNLVKFIYKDYPLVEIHPWAMHAAVNANCLAAQSGAAYWQYVDYVHAHREEISGTSKDVKQSTAMLDKLAQDQGQSAKLDLVKLEQCIAKQDDSGVRASMKQGDAVGVSGTPTIFINGERISGVLPPSLLWTAIDRALKAAGVPPPTEASPAKAESQPPPIPQNK